jgi:hypothetical protein
MLRDLLTQKCAHKKRFSNVFHGLKNVKIAVRKSKIGQFLVELVEQAPGTYFQFDVFLIYMLWGIQNQ